MSRRPKFAPYSQAGTLEPYLKKIQAIATFVLIPKRIHVYRDPRVDKFLEVAVHGQADLIVTGNAELLALNPFCGVAIHTPGEYLEQK